MAGAAGQGLKQLRNFLMERALRKAPRPPVDPIKRWRIVRGDMVEVIAPSHPEQGKQGKVLRVDRRKNRLYVEGINLNKKAMRAEGTREGGIVPIEAPVHYSAVNLVDPTTKVATKFRMRYLADGAKVRVSKTSGSILPKPEESRMRRKPRASGAWHCVLMISRSN